MTRKTIIPQKVALLGSQCFWFASGGAKVSNIRKVSQERGKGFIVYIGLTKRASKHHDWLLFFSVCCEYGADDQYRSREKAHTSFSPCMRFTAGCTPCFPRGVLFIKTNGTTAWRGSPVQRGPCGPISEEDVMNANLLDVLVWILIASHKPNTHFLGEQI